MQPAAAVAPAVAAVVAAKTAGSAFAGLAPAVAAFAAPWVAGGLAAAAPRVERAFAAGAPAASWVVTVDGKSVVAAQAAVALVAADSPAAASAVVAASAVGAWAALCLGLAWASCQGAGPPESRRQGEPCPATAARVVLGEFLAGFATDNRPSAGLVVASPVGPDSQACLARLACLGRSPACRVGLQARPSRIAAESASRAFLARLVVADNPAAPAENLACFARPAVADSLACSACPVAEDNLAFLACRVAADSRARLVVVGNLAAAFRNRAWRVGLAFRAYPVAPACRADLASCRQVAGCLADSRAQLVRQAWAVGPPERVETD